RIARRFGLFEIGLGYLGGVAGREPAPGPRAGRVPCLRQIPLLGLAGILAAELLTQVGLFVPIPADAADPAPETHSASLVPVGVLGAPDAPHRIAGPDQDDDESESIQPDHAPAGPEVGREVEHDQQGAAVEDPA